MSLIQLVHMGEMNSPFPVSTGVCWFLCILTSQVDCAIASANFIRVMRTLGLSLLTSPLHDHSDIYDYHIK